MGGGRHAGAAGGGSYMSRGGPPPPPSLVDHQRAGLQSGGIGRSVVPPPRLGQSLLLQSQAPAPMPTPPATANLRPPSSHTDCPGVGGGAPPYVVPRICRPTPGPLTAMAAASRKIMSTYPGKPANQDASVVQNIAAFEERPDAAHGAAAPAPAAGRAELPRAEAGGDAIIGVYDGYGQHGNLVSNFIKDRLASEIRQIDQESLRSPARSRRGRARRGAPSRQRGSFAFGGRFCVKSCVSDA